MDNDLMADDAKAIAKARNSFAGNLQTDRLFDDFIAVTGMLRRRIEEGGTFIDPLNDLSNAIARNERHINPAKSDTIIRDLFKARFGMTMNKMREDLIAREQALFDRQDNPATAERQKAYQAAVSAGELVQHGTKMTFNRAFASEAAPLAKELGITHIAAKKFIAQSFQEVESRDFFEWGKALDEKYYRPQIEAEKRQRTASRSQAHSQLPSYS